MDQALTRFWRRKPIQVEAWRYIDANDLGNLPQWVVDLINTNQLHFNPRGYIELPFIKQQVNLGDWIVTDPKKLVYAVFTHEQFQELYEPAPIGMNTTNGKVSSTCEQQSTVLPGRGDDGNCGGVS